MSEEIQLFNWKASSGLESHHRSKFSSHVWCLLLSVILEYKLPAVSWQRRAGHRCQWPCLPGTENIWETKLPAPGRLALVEQKKMGRVKIWNDNDWRPGRENAGQRGRSSRSCYGRWWIRGPDRSFSTLSCFENMSNTISPWTLCNLPPLELDLVKKLFKRRMISAPGHRGLPQLLGQHKGGLLVETFEDLLVFKLLLATGFDSGLSWHVWDCCLGAPGQSGIL